MANSMDTTESSTPFDKIREGFNKGVLKSIKERKVVLQCILKFLTQEESQIIQALFLDLRRCKSEAYLEIHFVRLELEAILKGMDKWLEDEYVPRTLLTALDSVYVQRQPLGVVLVIGSWNYPIAVSLQPVIGAIAAGNTVLLKPSEVGPACAEALALLSNYVKSNILQIVTGDATVCGNLIANNRFDHIFYTGNVQVGRIVYKAAAEKLTPVTLELGGKSPVYVDECIDVQKSARRIVGPKFLNAGQICISPDYVLCHTQVVDEFCNAVCQVVVDYYGTDPENNPDLARIINKRHFDRLVNLIRTTRGKILTGGNSNESDLYISPTIVRDVQTDDSLMSDEIFGPILPIVTVQSVDEAVQFINNRSKPLAMSVYTDDSSVFDRFKYETTSGSIMHNGTLTSIIISELPFGGVGDSGIGRFRGKYSIDNFSHHRAIVVKTSIEKPETYLRPPYSDYKLGVASRMLSFSHQSRCQLM